MKGRTSQKANCPYWKGSAKCKMESCEVNLGNHMQNIYWLVIS